MKFCCAALLSTATAEYVVGTYGTVCPDGAADITSEDDCKAAVTSLGMNYHGSDTDPGAPHGCITWSGNPTGWTRYNENEAGTYKEVSTIAHVCKGTAVVAQKKYARGYTPYVGNSPAATATITDEMRAAVPAALDWSTTGATTAVKDQGRCGSCWAFSATEGIESALWMATKSTMDLATQQIVACDKTDGGCNGGNLDTAFTYVQKNGGIDVLSDYADTSSAHGVTGKCVTKHKKKVVQVTDFKYAVPPCQQGACSSQHEHEEDLKAALNTYGPLSICVNAQTWDYYEGGVFKEECSGAAYEQDHCVQLVGFDTAANYWKVRNSWTTGWGEGGYIRLPIGSNACGVADCAMYVAAELVDSDITV